MSWMALCLILAFLKRVHVSTSVPIPVSVLYRVEMKMSTLSACNDMECGDMFQVVCVCVCAV